MAFLDERRFREALERLLRARSEEEERRALDDIEFYGPVDSSRPQLSRAFRPDDEPKDEDAAWAYDDEAV